MNHILSLELRGPQNVTAMLLLLDMRLWFGTVGRSLRLPCEVCLFRSFIHSFIHLLVYPSITSLRMLSPLMEELLLITGPCYLSSSLG